MWQSFAKWMREEPGWLGLSVDQRGMTLVELCPTAMATGQIQRWSGMEWDAPPAQPWQDPVGRGVALETLRKRAGISCRRLAVGLPRDQVIQQTLEVERDLPLRDVGLYVIWVASQALQLDEDAVVVDYLCEPTGSHPQDGSSGMRRVDWVASPKSWVQAAEQMSHAAGLRLQYLGVEPGPCEAGFEAPSTGYRVACEMAWQGARS